MKFVFRLPRRSAPVRVPNTPVEAMEARLLLSATITNPIPNLTVSPGTISQFDLSSSFTDPNVTGTVVQIQTTLGSVIVALDDQQARTTATNFAEYVAGGSYNGTIIHQSLTGSGQQLLRGGSFTVSGQHISTLPAVPNEATLSNVRGTIAADLDNPADPNSATSGFLFNLGDNSATLDPQHYTVFGNVVAGLNVLDQINALPTTNAATINPLFSSVPVLSATQGVSPTNVVTVTNTSFIPSLSFTATSDNPALVQPSVNGTSLTLNFTSGSSGYARVRVVATDVGGNQVSQLVRVKVLADPTRSMDVPLRSGHSVQFVDSNHSSGTISLSGPGSAVVHVSGDGLQVRGGRVRGNNQQVETVTITGATPATSLVVNGHPRRGKVLTIGDIKADGPLRMIHINNVELIGDLTAAGPVPTVFMSAAQNGTISIGAGNKPVRLTVGGFADENFTSGAPIASITNGNWTNTDQLTETFSAPFIRRLFSFGSFAPGLQLSGAGAGHKTLGNILVGGTVDGVWRIKGASAPLHIGASAPTWDATFDSLPSIVVTSLGGALTVPRLSFIRVRRSMAGASLTFTQPFASGALNLGSLDVNGAIISSAIRSAGNIGSISAAEFQGSIVGAGIGSLSSNETLPTTASEFASPAQVRSISLHPAGRNIGFVASDVAASTVGALTMGTTRVANGGTPFGVAAHSIGRLNGRDLTHRQNLAFSNLTSDAALAQQVAARHLNLQDFTIRLL